MPSYNPGPVLERTVREVLSVCPELWVVIDGSTDGSEKQLEAFESSHPFFRLIRCANNRGKGAAVLHGADLALKAGYTHALVMDCDGQHPSGRIEAFIDASRRHPESMVLGQPVFGPEAPRERLWGRQLSVAVARLEVLGPWIGDPLFGFRVYPLDPLLRVLRKEGRGRRYDFDHEAAVRLFWAGTPAVRMPAVCRYLEPGEGGVSHFSYLRDNTRLVLLHFRLLPGWLFRLPSLIIRRKNLA
jgi:glycosyltransferase involved in cell wall biosynthesis